MVGNLVTMRWWDDLWLNESFANVMEYLALDACIPTGTSGMIFAAKELTLALGRDQYGSIQPVAYHVRTPDDIAAVFDKAILYKRQPPDTHDYRLHRRRGLSPRPQAIFY